MAEQDGQEKTEQPTGKRIDDTRKEGKVAKSTEVNSFAVFTTGLLMIYFTQSFLSHQLASYTTSIFSSLSVVAINKDFIQNFAKEGVYFYLITLAPIFGALLVISFVASVSQVGFKVSMKALAPKMTKFNPVNGIKNIMISSRSLVEVLKSILKLAIIGGFTYSILSDLIVKSSTLVEFTTGEILHFMVHSAFDILWKVSLIYVLMAAADLIFQKKKFKKEIMMTKQEVKEENKQSEGDPIIKSRIKKEQFASAKRRMMKAIPTADVVITNPTHYAIALKYDSSKNAAPLVVAKGVDELAQRIKAIAVENGIPLHEDRALARALYKVCDVGDEIPASLFKAVAQILAYVFQLKNYKKKRSIV